ncbi:unnamed protein product [Lampetra planeri]
MKNAAVERARRDVPRVRRFWKTAPGPAIWGVPRVYVAVSDVIFPHSRRANGSINLGDKKCPFSASAVHRGLVRGSRSGCGDCGTEIRELAGVD